jgi:phosphoenolpyruvate carboxykinase (ATP)
MRKDLVMTKRYGLENIGFANLGEVHWNLPIEELQNRATSVPKSAGAVTWLDVADRFIAKETTTSADIAWGEYNRPFDAGNFSLLLARMLAFFQKRDVYVEECWLGSDPDTRMPVRIVTENAVEALAVREYYQAVSGEDILPELTLIHAPSFAASPDIDSTASSRFSVINFESRIGLVGGTTGIEEIKNLLFKLVSFVETGENILPLRAALARHASEKTVLIFGAKDEDLESLKKEGFSFIGLSESLWSPEGVRPMNAVAQNLTLANSHPSEIFILASDESCALPVLALLDSEQARYYFVSGFRGGSCFDPCFAADAIARDPLFYGEQFKRKLERYGVKSWLMNSKCASISEILRKKSSDSGSKLTVNDGSLSVLFTENFRRVAGTRKMV